MPIPLTAIPMLKQFWPCCVNLTQYFINGSKAAQWMAISALTTFRYYSLFVEYQLL